MAPPTQPFDTEGLPRMMECDRSIWIVVAGGAFVLGCGGDATGPGSDPTPTYDALAILTAALSSGIDHVAYEDSLRATGGDGTYTWSLSSLPSGLAYDAASGAISGVPVEVGVVSVAVEVRSGDGQVETSSIPLEITERPVIGADASCSGQPEYTVTSIAEPMIESQVRTVLAIDSTEALTCGLLTGITRVVLEASGISDLTGMQNLVSLTYVDLSHNDIEDLGPLSSLALLEHLDLRSNRVSDLTPLSGLTGLAELMVPVNAISDLTGLEGLTGLRVLRFAGNDVTDLGPLAGLTGLESLQFSSNRVTSLAPLEELTSLQSLWFDWNQVTDLTPLTAMTQMAGLSLRDNGVSALTGLEDMAQLTYLDAFGNGVADVSALASHTALVRLRLDNNAVADVDPLSGLTALDGLELANNHVTSVDAFEGLRALSGLGLYGNADLTDIGGILANIGLEPGDWVDLRATAVSCTDVDSLTARGVIVYSDC